MLIADQLKELQLALLQLQRSALIDNQTVLQLMIDKGLCTVEEIVNMRIKIESDSPDIQRIDSEIVEHGGAITRTPVPESISNKSDLKNQLLNLINQLKDVSP